MQNKFIFKCQVIAALGKWESLLSFRHLLKVFRMKQDIEIAQEVKIRPVAEIASILGIPPEQLELLW
jgi:hypothetical protein